MSAFAPIITVDEPPRGGDPQTPATFAAQSIRATFSWGSSPGIATIVYPGSAPVTAGALVTVTAGGHLFAGLCRSDAAERTSGGNLRTLEFVDLRYLLGWDNVTCCFNKVEVVTVGGVRKKRYWHIYPEDFDAQIRTYTDGPLLGYEILSLLFNAPTVNSPWVWDLTSNGQFPGGVMGAPVYDLDCLSGKRLDAVLNELSQRQGLVFTHQPLAGNLYRLVWTRKGYGVLSFPVQSDGRRSGVALSENPTNVRVLGGRNRYQVLNLSLQADWAPGWEQFLVFDAFVWDIYLHETDPASGEAYAAYPDDAEHWIGYHDARVRALEMTVREYAALRQARDGTGAAFTDTRQAHGRYRLDMPAALYIDTLLRRAFRPAAASIESAWGEALPLDSAPLVDAMICRVNLDYATGVMTAVPGEPEDGNGVMVVKGYQAGADLFRLADPDTLSSSFFSAGSRSWGTVPFAVDDDGEGGRFLIAESPVFVSSDVPGEELMVEVDGAAVLNAAFVLQTPTAKATLTFEGDRYSYYKSGSISASRDVIENVPVQGDYVGESALDYVEVPYANGMSADAIADSYAEALLLQQYYYQSGGYELKWDPGTPLSSFGTALSSLVDRVQIEVGPNGIVESVDFTTERQRDAFEPERDLDRRTVQNTLYPGQTELRRQAEDTRRLTSGIKQLQKTGDMQLFQRWLRGESGRETRQVWVAEGAGTVPAGTPITTTGTRRAVTPTASTTRDAFAGVTVRQNEDLSRPLKVQTSGTAWCRVQGPVALNGGVGLVAGETYLGASSQPVGRALRAIEDTAVVLIPVALGMADSSGQFPFRIYTPLVGPTDPEDEADPWWRTVLVRCGYYGHLKVTSGTDGVDFPDTDPVPALAPEPGGLTPVVVPAGTLQYFFWIQYEPGTGTVEVRHSADPAANGWSAYPSMDAEHVPIGFVDTLTLAAQQRIKVRQIGRTDVWTCNI